MTFLAPPDVDLDATAVVDLDGTRATTWRTLDRHLHQVAAGLQAEGLGGTPCHWTSERSSRSTVAATFSP